MSDLKAIKKRLDSIKNIHKISKALEMVAASKVQKAQEKAISLKPYAEKIYELVQSFSGQADVEKVPFLKIPEKVKSDLIVLISTNRGLCGSLNTNLFKFVDNWLKGRSGIDHLFVALGKKGRKFSMLHGKLLADFSDYQTKQFQVSSLVELISDNFISGEVDEILLVYNDFVSALVQEPKIKSILPIDYEEFTKSKKNGKGDSDKLPNYNFEPPAEKLLARFIPFYLEIQIREAIIEAQASEHSARMLAMKNASDNAMQLSFSLNLEYNSARQQAITTELADIVTSKISLKEGG